MTKKISRYLFGASMFILAVALGLLGEILLKSDITLIAYIALSISGLLFFSAILLLLLDYLRKTLWPGRDKWVASSSYPSLATENDPQRAIDKGKEWRSSSPQKSQQWFRIDLAKERMIANIDMAPDEAWIEKPKKWRMTFRRANRNISIGRPVDGEGFISVGSNRIPKHIRYISVYIIEPMDDMPEGTNYTKMYGKQIFWTISVEMKEFRFGILGKRFLKHEL